MNDAERLRRLEELIRAALRTKLDTIPDTVGDESLVKVYIRAKHIREIEKLLNEKHPD